MRILFYSVEFGGTTTTFIRNELDYFSANCEIMYLCQQVKKGVVPPDYVKVIPFVQNKITRKLQWVLWRNDIVCNNYSRAYSRAVKNVVREFGPDVIHCHFAYEGLFLLDNLGKLRHKIILHFHGYDASQMTKKTSYVRKLKRILSLPNVFPISCNRYFAKHLSVLTGTPISRFFVLYYGVDVSLFKPNRSATTLKDEKLFLQVSSLSSKKGHEFTFRAFARLIANHPEIPFRLIVTGDGEKRGRLEALAEVLGIRHKVEFAGTVCPTKAVELMNRADVFVHHSVTTEMGDKEGIPNALIEAMAMELPIISTWHSGIPELVEDNINGFLIEERNVEDYSRKMHEALQFNKLAYNREKVVQLFEKDLHNIKLNEFYHLVLDR